MKCVICDKEKTNGVVTQGKFICNFCRNLILGVEPVSEDKNKKAGDSDE